MVNSLGMGCFQDWGLLATLVTAVDAKDNAAAREGALNALGAIATKVGAASEPYLLPLLPTVLAKLADKSSSVRASAQASQRQPPAAIVLPRHLDALHA